MFFGVGEIFEFSPRIFGVFTLFAFMYFSLMAVFYLLYSVMWKKWNGDPKKIYIFHLLALIVGLLSILPRSLELRLALNFILILFVSVIFYIVYREAKHKRNNLYAIYLLLFIFWILDVVDIFVPRFLETFQLLIYLASLGVFLLILYKTLKKAGN